MRNIPMIRLAALALTALILGGCEKCTAPADVNVGVGIGSGGSSGAVSVGRSCGPGYIRFGVGNSYHMGWY